MQSTAAVILLALASVLSSASGHGVIVSPPPRTPGAAYQAVCGNTIYNNQKADPAGPVELLLQSAGSIVDAAACNMWLCKGYQFADNGANVQTYARGEKVPMRVDIRAPHTGYANVSIVDTASNSVVGTALRSWKSYASTATGVGAGETAFDITVPADLDGCSSPGDCVIQWFWYSPPGVDQTYEGCIDFVVAGSAATSKKPPATTTTVPKYISSAARTTSSIPMSVYTTTSIPPPVYSTTAIPTSVYTTTAIPTSPYTTTAMPTSVYTNTTIPTSVYTTTAIPTSVYTNTTLPTSLYTNTTIPTSVYTTTSVPPPAYPTTAMPMPPYMTKAIPMPPYMTTPIPMPSYMATPIPMLPYMTAGIPTPSTLKKHTRTHMRPMATTAPLPCATKTPQSINRCLDRVNACIRGMRGYHGGAVDFSACEAQRAACY